MYGGLAVAIPFIHTRPRYFAQIIGELLYWIGEDKILFASDYALWTPKWLIEKFVDFQIPEDMTRVRADHRRGRSEKILGLNAAALYDIDVPAELRLATRTPGHRGGRRRRQGSGAVMTVAVAVSLESDIWRRCHRHRPRAGSADHRPRIRAIGFG